MRADELRAAGLLSTGEDVSPEAPEEVGSSSGEVGMTLNGWMIKCQQKKEGAKVGWLRMSEACDLSDCK